jgi:hypothetical protein
MRLLYILYCPPTPAKWGQGSFNPFAILHVPVYRGHVFGWSRQRGETGITPPHAGWQRTQKILLLVTLMPHMQNGQGQNHPWFFVTFLYCQNHREKLIL